MGPYHKARAAFLAAKGVKERKNQKYKEMGSINEIKIEERIKSIRVPDSYAKTAVWDKMENVDQDLNAKNGKQKFKCPECPKVYSSASSLRCHVPVHSDKHKCLKCDVRFSCPSKLARHSCDNSEQLQCPECPLVYSNKVRLQSHMPVHSNKHKCHKCGCGFPNPSKLARHSCEATLKKRAKKSVLRKRDFINTPQSDKSNTEDEGETEKSPLKNQIFHCPECPKLYSSLQALRSHIIVHTGEHRCPNCQNSFRSPSEMARHSCKATLKKRSVAVAECQECGMRFGVMHAFRQHTVAHPEKFKCQSCQRRSLRDQNSDGNCQDCKKGGELMETHIETSRLLYSAPNKNINGVAAAECQTCGMRFASMSAFRNHKVSHTDKFKCGSCQMRFSAEPNHKEKSEECKKAGKIRDARIRRSRLLYSAPAEAVKMTKRNTPGVAVAECLECGMRFGTERAYTRHKVSHTDKYKCEHCHISFSTNRKHKKEDCKKVGKYREAMIERSRLLYSAPETLVLNQPQKRFPTKRKSQTSSANLSRKNKEELTPNRK